MKEDIIYIVPKGIYESSKKDTIAPFPQSIDRKVFGAWLSGFVDGEGCFHLPLGKSQSSGRRCPKAELIIQLRSDDIDVIRLIQSFWQCGRLNNVVHLRGVRLTIAKIKHLSTIIVPHFNCFPLFAKKKNDFNIWREAVTLLSHISNRPNRGGHGLGPLPKHTEDEYSLFVSLKQKLEQGRKFKENVR